MLMSDAHKHLSRIFPRTAVKVASRGISNIIPAFHVEWHFSCLNHISDSFILLVGEGERVGGREERRKGGREKGRRIPLLEPTF